jgi:hypothetical protein
MKVAEDQPGVVHAENHSERGRTYKPPGRGTPRKGIMPARGVSVNPGNSSLENFICIAAIPTLAPSGWPVGMAAAPGHRGISRR